MQQNPSEEVAKKKLLTVVVSLLIGRESDMRIVSHLRSVGKLNTQLKTAVTSEV